MYKSLLCLILLVFLAQPLIAQTTDTLPPVSTLATHDMLMKKSKSNKTAAWIMLGSGFTLAATGFLIYFHGQIESDYDNPGNALFYTGASVMAFSIPLFISAANNKKKAQLSLKGETITGGNIVHRFRSYPAVGLTISL